MQHLYRTSSDGESLLYAWFSAMHTRVDIALIAPSSEEQMLGIAREIKQEIHRLETLGNCFDPTSELARVNRLAYTQPQVVSPELYHILHLCKEAYTRTRGHFDITIHSEAHTPDTIHALCLQAETHTVKFEKPGIRLNLSGFLKGYALDCIRPMLQKHAIENALINLGNSSIMALGNQPSGVGWKLEAGITLHDQCLTTSGNDTPERRHIINPQTGQPVWGKREIKVITSQGMWGEICSTALFACPDEQRPALLESLEGLIWSNSSSL